jgi:hypothetical protein
MQTQNKMVADNFSIVQFNEVVVTKVRDLYLSIECGVGLYCFWRVELWWAMSGLSYNCLVLKKLYTWYQPGFALQFFHNTAVLALRYCLGFCLLIYK